MFGCCCNISGGMLVQVALNYDFRSTYNTEIFDDIGTSGLVDGSLVVDYLSTLFDPPESFSTSENPLAPILGAFDYLGVVCKGGYEFSGTPGQVIGRELVRLITGDPYAEGCLLNYSTAREYGDLTGTYAAPDSYDDGVDAGSHLAPVPAVVTYPAAENYTVMILAHNQSYADITFPIDYSAVYWMNWPLYP